MQKITSKRPNTARPRPFIGLGLALAVVWGLNLGPISFAFAGASKVVVGDIRAGLHGSTTRLVFDLSDKVPFEIFTLAGPDRVVLDLPQVGWRLPSRPLPAKTGVLKKLRYGLFKPGTTRVVLEVTGPVMVKKTFLLEPSGGRGWRFILDLARTSREAFSKQTGLKTSLDMAGKTPRKKTPSLTNKTANKATPALRVSAALMPPRKPAVRIIAIDPGHGGADPGTKGGSGIYEKYLTLAAARALKEELEGTGRFKVILTRTRDVFVRLRDRIQIMRNQGAELFISLHADAIENKKVQGASVYTLSETASDAEAAQLAEKENKADLIAGVDLSAESPEVTGILIDLAQRETMNSSSQFAALLVRELGRDIKVLRNTHRFAGFAVLKAPDVPSVLLEMGFLSNSGDEKVLRSKAYRQRLARAVARSADAYFAGVEEALRR